MARYWGKEHIPSLRSKTKSRIKGRTPGSHLGQGHQEQGNLCHNGLPVSCPTFFVFLCSFFKVCFRMYLFITYCDSQGVDVEVSLHQDNRPKLGLLGNPQLIHQFHKSWQPGWSFLKMWVIMFYHSASQSSITFPMFRINPRACRALHDLASAYLLSIALQYSLLWVSQSQPDSFHSPTGLWTFGFSHRNIHRLFT